MADQAGSPAGPVVPAGRAAPAYLEAAAAAGQLYHLAGLPYTAGVSTEPVTGERRCLVEYCDPDLGSGGRLEELRATLAPRFPDCHAVLVRLPGEAEPAPLWTPCLTYVRYQGARAPAPPPGDPPVTVRPAGPADESAIAGWLVRALQSGAEAQGRPPVADLHAFARGMLRAPGRRAFVATAGGTLRGHATVLTDAYDDVTGQRFVELVDVLVEPGAGASAVTGALVSAAAAEAAAAGLPLLGHVVHPREVRPGDRDPADVVASLQRRGWVVAYRYHLARAPHDHQRERETVDG